MWAIKELSLLFPQLCFMPVHLNPNVQEPVQKILSKRSNVLLIPPLSYNEFAWQ